MIRTSIRGEWRKRAVLFPGLEGILASKAQVAFESTFSPESALVYGGKKATVEKHWQELFLDPTEWRDHRSDKTNPRFPDFIHKTHTDKALWLDSKWIPTWVEAKLAAEGSWALESTCSSEGEDRKAEEEKLWQEMFSNPTEWWDHRSDKANPRFPDFKHKKHTDKALWVKSGFIPPWVEANLAAMPPGTIELSNFSWNQRLSRYAQAGQHEKTVELFQQMQRDGKTADKFTFPPVLKACASLGHLELCRRVHTMMPPGFEKDIFIGNTLVDMYAKCGSIEEAERVFMQMPAKDVVTLNAMISGYVKCGEGQKALKLFENMEGQGVDPDLVTYVGLLNACASVAALEVGRFAHELIIRRGYESDVVVGNCLIDMYAKCGSIEEAGTVFKEMPTRNVVTLNAMIGGYVKCGQGHKALELYEQMQRQGVDPTNVTFVGVLNACASVAALEGGRRVHQEIVDRGYESDVVVGTCLVDMYAKCGSIEEAERVFNQMPKRNVVAWTAMIAGYGIHGYPRRALETFKEMCKAVKVNGVTFLSLLSACSHGGLVAEGLEYFKSMSAVYNITPTVEHISCVVDLLGRAGRLGEAEDLIRSMPMDPNAEVWMTLLGACGAHANVDIGERCVKRVLELDPDNEAVFVLKSNLYVAAGNFHSDSTLSGEVV